MIHSNKRTLAILSLAACVALAGACSDDDENNGNVDPNNVATDAGGDTGTMDMGGVDDMGTEEDMGTDDMGTEEDMGTDDMGTEEDMGMDMGTPFDGYLIFDEGLSAGITFAAFDGATNAITETEEEAYSGTTSLKVSVPDAGYTGGAWVPDAPVDLSEYNALSFYVKASQAATLNTAGLGNTGEDATQQVELGNIPLTTDWQQVIIPLPDPSLATNVSGLFHFAEGTEGVYDIYFDEVAYVSVDPSVLTNPSGAFANTATSIVTGQTTSPAGTVYIVDISGTTTTFAATPFWFSWTSSDDTVATVDGNGVVTGVAGGTARITGTLAGEAAGGELTVTVIPGPATAAPTPTTPAADVEASLFSNAYTNVPVNTFRAGFSSASLTETDIGGDDVLVYGNLDFVGIEMTGANSLDVSASTMLHIDIWTPNANLFAIKLVDWGADNAFGGGDDTETQIDLTDATTPAIVTGQWVSIDLPLADFLAGPLASLQNLSQIILVGRIPDGSGGFIAGQATVFVDNFYFY